MDKFELRGKVPDDACSVDLVVVTFPPLASILIRRSTLDTAPLIMSAGMSTTMGVPEGRVLYIESGRDVDTYEIIVAGWSL